MSFEFNFSTNTTSGSGDRKQVDWAAMNQEVIDIVGTQKKAKSVVGYVSGVVALGKQPQLDAEVVFVGTEEDERKAIAEKPLTYFKDGTDDKGNPVRLKCWPQPPIDCVAITVDFGQFKINKNKYFGDTEAEAKPLRLLMNGEFVFKGQPYTERGLAKLYKLKVQKNPQDKWSIAANSKLYQLAVATGVIEDGDAFVPNDIGKLIGKSAQFQIRVYMKDDKYFTEEISLAGLIPEGLPIPEVDPETLYGVYFDKPNNPECLKQLRVSIRNQMKKATNYEGSVVQQELDSIFTYNAPAQPQEAPKEEAKATVAPKAKTPPKAAPVVTEDSEDSPF